MRLINFPVFIVSFIFGMLYVYYTAPQKKQIIVYPTDDNKHLFQFRDKINNCFELQQSIIECNKDAEIIPLQI